MAMHNNLSCHTYYIFYSKINNKNIKDVLVHVSMRSDPLSILIKAEIILMVNSHRPRLYLCVGHITMFIPISFG